MNTFKLHLSGRVSFGVCRKSHKLKPPVRLHGDMLAASQHYEVFPEELPGDVAALPPMDLSRLSNSTAVSPDTKRARRGSTGITTAGQNLVKDAATWLELEYGRDRLSFWTLTIPPEFLTKEMVSEWSNVVDRLKKRMQRLLESVGLPTHFLLVTEVQESRYLRNGGTVPLHVHALFVGALRPYQWLLTKTRLTALWGSLLKECSGLPMCPLLASRIESVRKSAAGYLGKYMSKGSKAVSGVPEDCRPTAWYSCTNDLKRVVKALVLRVSGATATSLYDYLVKSPHLFRWSKHVRMKFGDSLEMAIGWYGDLVGRTEYDFVHSIATSLATDVRRGHLWSLPVAPEWLNRATLSSARTERSDINYRSV